MTNSKHEMWSDFCSPPSHLYCVIISLTCVIPWQVLFLIVLACFFSVESPILQALHKISGS